MPKGGYTYIISNKRRTVLYTGVTSDLENRMYEHKNGVIEGFSKRYNCTDLLWFEVLDHIESAIAREKQIKNWKRSYKEELIVEMNPDWLDLTDKVVGFN